MVAPRAHLSPRVHPAAAANADAAMAVAVAEIGAADRMVVGVAVIRHARQQLHPLRGHPLQAPHPMDPSR